MLINADHSSSLGNLTWLCIPAVIPEALIEKPAIFPPTWRDFPHGNDSREFGTVWALERRTTALRVPSAVVPGEFNFLLNPAHPEFSRVKIGKAEPFNFDPPLTA